MTDKYTLTSADVRDYTRLHQPAMLLLGVATDDYAGARCCLLNGLFSGFVLAAQAVEKIFKAIILFKDPCIKPRSFSHNLTELTNEVSGSCPNLNLVPHTQTIKNLEVHYSSRYPDNPVQPRSQASDELVPIDTLIIYLNELLPMPIEARIRSGLFGWVCSSRERKGVVFPNEYWLKYKNRALAPLLPRIFADSDELLMFWNS